MASAGQNPAGALSFLSPTVRFFRPAASAPSQIAPFDVAAVPRYDHALPMGRLDLLDAPPVVTTPACGPGQTFSARRRIRFMFKIYVGNLSYKTTGDDL